MSRRQTELQTQSRGGWKWVALKEERMTASPRFLVFSGYVPNVERNYSDNRWKKKKLCKPNR
jgi:hypothetical protein